MSSTQATGGSSSGGQSGTGGTSGSNADCTDTATAQGTLSKQYTGAMIPVTGSTKTYYLSTNWWHLYSAQTESYSGLSFTIADPQKSSVPSSDGNPMGFPTLFIGSYSGNSTTGSNLPKQVSSLTSVPTVFSTNALEKDTSNFNATYDVWFTSSGTALNRMASSPGAGGAYLMVWMFKPKDRQPRGGLGPGTGGSPTRAALTVDGVSGTWDVWIDSASDPPCISYVSTTPLDGLAFDLNKFIQDSVTNQYGIKSSMYLSLVFAGFEVWGGGDGLQLKQFCANVN